MKKSIFKIVLLGACLISFISAKAQEKTVIFGKEISQEYINPSTGKIQCISHQHREHQEELRQKSGFKQQLAKLVEYQETNEVYVIPVVVHVIHSGQNVGVGRNISNARVLSQIDVLNEDFRKMIGTPGFGNNSLGVDTEIEFCLAKTDPSGNLTNGINRVNLGNTTWNEYNVETILKPQTQWNPNMYFNIWVCEFGGNLNGVLGYAQFPSNSGLGGLFPNEGPANTDGVIIDWRCFGRASQAPGTYFSGYAGGRTTTHEIGHAFGLFHIWGDNSSCTVNTLDSVQDYCPDTPPHQGPNGTCTATWQTTCSGHTPMPENYMDYGTDNCLNTFTPNQKTRMRTVLQNATRRSSLKTSTVCNDPLSTDKFDLGMISLYPNPANDVLNLFVPDNYSISGDIVIYNTIGQKVYSVNISETSTYSIDISNLTQGTYLLKLNNEDTSKTLKFVKK